MNFTLEQLSKDISKIDQTDILSECRWLMPEIKSILIVTCMGDMFVEDSDGKVLFLFTAVGKPPTQHRRGLVFDQPIS